MFAYYWSICKKLFLRFFFHKHHKSSKRVFIKSGKKCIKLCVFLSFLFPLVSLTAKKDIDLPRIESAIQSGNQTAFSHCNCAGIKETKDCSPECFFFCSLTGTLLEAQVVMDSKCEESKKTIVVNKTSGIFGLSSTYKKAGEKISELKKSQKPLPQKEGCEHCSEVSKIINLTQPYVFKEESCDPEYIKVHSYDEELTFNEKASCTEKQRKKLTKQLQKYGKHILRGGGSADTKEKSEILNDNCPGDCSFYVNTIITLDQKICSGKIDLIVNCHHKKASDYIVHISYQQQRQCSKEI